MSRVDSRVEPGGLLFTSVSGLELAEEKRITAEEEREREMPPTGERSRASSSGSTSSTSFPTRTSRPRGARS
jgi:hypothetical protein